MPDIVIEMKGEAVEAMTIGNVCPARRGVGRVSGAMVVLGLPHEPAEGFRSVLGPFCRPVKMMLCRHCGALYAEVIGCGAAGQAGARSPSMSVPA